MPVYKCGNLQAGMSKDHPSLIGEVSKRRSSGDGIVDGLPGLEESEEHGEDDEFAEFFHAK
eukprot:8309973-Prorocentrum_lima.AAC.1